MPLSKAPSNLVKNAPAVARLVFTVAISLSILVMAAEADT